MGSTVTNQPPTNPVAPSAGQGAPPKSKLVQLPTPPPVYRNLRKRIHLVCFAIFLLLPFLNIMRFDLPKQRFYFAGQELWISEFAIIFFALMFLLFVIVALTLIWGRFYCGYLCPQNIFSEAFAEFEEAIRRRITKHLIDWPASRRKWLERVLVYSGIAVASVFLSFVFIAYFVEPRDLLNRLMALDVKTAGGIAGASVTLITFLDFAFLRHTFCTTACPYGYLQSMLVDGNSMLVDYREPGAKKACIECKKCVRVCYMGIDIRTSPHQMECIHCGECVDACNIILAKLGKPGLIHYTWGEDGPVVGTPGEPWYKRWGFRDGKRVAVLAVIGFYTLGLVTYLMRRHPVHVQVSPLRSESLYRVTPDGQVENHFRLAVANRSSQSSEVTIEVKDLPGISLSLQQPVKLAGGEQKVLEVVVRGSFDRSAPDVNHFRLLTIAMPRNDVDEFRETFLLPPKEKR